MFTYSFFRNPKTGSLHLRLINNRRKAEMELGVKATEAEFSDALSSRPKTTNERLSLTLKGVENVVREVQMDFINLHLDQNMDVKEIRTMVKERMGMGGDVEKERTEGFGAFFERYAKTRRSEKTRYMYGCALKRIVEFCKDAPVPFRKKLDDVGFSDITKHWVVSFDEWMKGKGMQPNTRRTYLNNIHAVVREALDDGLIDRDPFRNFRIPKDVTRNRALTVEELRRLFSYPVEKFQQFQLDMFKLIFMLIGINTKDLYNLKEITRDGRIEYQRAKTGRGYSIKVEPEAMEIIERWRGKKSLLCMADKMASHVYFITNLNNALGKIGERRRVAGSRKKEIIPAFPGLTAYWARHTWATVAREIGISVDDIALALGHGDGHDLTHIYIKESRDRIDAANRKVLDYVLYGGKPQSEGES